MTFKADRSQIIITASDASILPLDGIERPEAVIAPPYEIHFTPGMKRADAV